MDERIRIPRRRFSLAMAGSLGLALPLGARAKQQIPKRPIMLTVPFAPGGSNDIMGRAIAERFAASGASVRIVDLAMDAAEQVAAGVTRAGGRASAHRCDVSDQADTARCFTAILTLEAVDILVNNAGVFLDSESATA